MFNLKVDFQVNDLVKKFYADLFKVPRGGFQVEEKNMFIASLKAIAQYFHGYEPDPWDAEESRLRGNNNCSQYQSNLLDIIILLISKIFIYLNISFIPLVDFISNG